MSDPQSSSLVSSSSRAIGLKKRADLVYTRQKYQGREYNVIKDPLSLKYFRFEDEEFQLFQMLDGTLSADQIKRAFEKKFAPQKITLAELQQFIGMLFSNSLLVSSAPGQGVQLNKRGGETKKKKRVAALSNVLAIRFKGFDPDRILNWLDRRVGWFFSLPAFIVCLGICFSAAILVTVQFDVFTSKLPSFQQFFAGENWIWIFVILGCTKVLHEFGHGLSCKRFGGECHEMGVMLLVFTPCLYCNVSDSWMLPSKWKRAAIGAAGMYIEVVLASVCTFLWWFSEPGMLKYVCLNIMFVSSVSTILFNANPLLRYDGYYILSDLLEIPNLRQKAQSILRRKLGKWCLGLPENPDPFLPQKNQWLFALYTVAASAYRWFIALAIFWFLYNLLEPYGLKILGQMVAGMAIWGLVGQPVVQLVKFFYVPGRLDKVKKSKAMMTSGVVAALVAGVLFIPFPYQVSSPFYIESDRAMNVDVDYPGSIRKDGVKVVAGELVEKGQPILELVNLDLEAEIARLNTQLRVKRTELEQTIQRELDDPDASFQIKSLESAVRAIEELIDQEKIKLEKLKIKSPTRGIVIPPRFVKPQESNDRLSGWSGYPLEDSNIGAFLVQKTPVCQVVPVEDVEKRAVLLIDQEFIEFIEKGQEVHFELKGVPGHQVRSTIQEISPVELAIAPANVSNQTGGPLITSKNERGEDVPQSATFPVRAPFESKDSRIRIGMTGYARIHAGSRTLGQRIWRFVCRTFNFDL
ncbi:MAG: hemolysin D [Planctomycetota bacterium]|nr:hemolysin D [Planctomycetota bacterium]